MTQIHVCANNVRNGMNLARQTLGLKLKYSRELQRTYVGGNIHESILADGTVVATEVRAPWPRGMRMELIS